MYDILPDKDNHIPESHVPMRDFNAAVGDEVRQPRLLMKSQFVLARQNDKYIFRLGRIVELVYLPRDTLRVAFLLHSWRWVGQPIGWKETWFLNETGPDRLITYRYNSPWRDLVEFVEWFHLGGVSQIRLPRRLAKDP
ncbi:hypothetical protein EVAR_5516_1 [Eumeta japonica]|uniref:Uncharacterized protein n=1 Tax=Eumeta variegata TaxID=151549 RepID=A0A4C1T9Z3_EUMVA|nr:hypothetical protein EVAR_5516_1 [Eumeta japonica]